MSVLVLICIVLALSSSPVGAYGREFAPYIPLAHSCTSDLECADGMTCTDDGVCVTPTTAIPNTSVVSTHRATILATIAAFSTCAVVLIIGPLSCCSFPCSLNRLNERDAAALFGLCCFAICCAVGMGVAVGVPLTKTKLPWIPKTPGNGSVCTTIAAFACDPYFCDLQTERCYESCMYDEECQPNTVCANGALSKNPAENGQGRCVASDDRLQPGVRKPVMSAGKAAGVGIGIGFCCCACCFALMASTVSEWRRSMCFSFDTDEARLFSCVYTTCCCLIVLSFIVSMSIGGSSKVVEYPRPANGTECSSNLKCAPYYCDMDAGKCHSNCMDDNACVPPYECSGYECVLPSDYSGIKVAAISLGGLSGIALSIACCCCCCSMGVAYNILDDNSNEGRLWALTCGLVCFLVIGFAIGTPTGLSHKNVDTTTLSTNNKQCAIINAVVCEPYFCDLQNAQCFSSCSTDADCSTSNVCEGGKCAADSSFKLSQTRVPHWVGLTVCLLVPIVLCLIISICGVRSLDFNWYGSIENIGRGINQHGPHVAASLLTGCVVALVVGGVVALVVFIPSHGAKYQPSADAPTKTVGNKTECSGLEASICSPYYCDVSGKVCFTGCKSDVDCRGDAVCEDGECIEHIISTLFPTYWNTYWLAVACGVAVLFSGVFCARLIAKASCSRNMMYGIQLERVPAVAVCTIFLSTILILCLRAGFTEIQRDYQPDGKGNHGTCDVLEDIACLPYFCDMANNKCFSSCETTAECTLGSICTEEGKCERDNLQKLRHAVITGGSSAVALMVLIGILPTFIRMYNNWRLARIDAEMARLRAIEEAEQAERERIKQEHPVFIDVDPHFAYDPSLPSPGDWAPDPNFRPPTDVLVDSDQEFPDVLPSPTPANASVNAGGGRGKAPADGGDGGGGGGEDSSDGSDIEAPLIGGGDGGGWGGGASWLANLIPQLRAQQPAGVNDGGESGGAGAGAAVPVLPTEWNCPLCTFLNPIEIAECQMCLQGQRPDNADLVGGSMEAFLSNNPIDESGLFEEALRESLKPEYAGPPKLTIPPTPEERMPGFTRVRTTDEFCSICYAEPSVVRFAGRQCMHGFCHECTETALNTIVDVGQFPARCPGCHAENMRHPDNDQGEGYISADVIEALAARGIIGLAFARRFINMSILRAFDPNDIISCPVCTMLNIKPDMSAKERRWLARDPHRVECAECLSAFCGKCNVLYRGHEGVSCATYAKRQASADEINSANLIATTSKRCPNCSMGISHYKGHACHHIRPGTGCPNCGIHFCIVCLERYPCSQRDHDLFCDDRCDCPPCPDCRPGNPCNNCDGGARCPSCSGN